MSEIFLNLIMSSYFLFLGAWFVSSTVVWLFVKILVYGAIRSRESQGIKKGLNVHTSTPDRVTLVHYSDNTEFSFRHDEIYFYFLIIYMIIGNIVWFIVL